MQFVTLLNVLSGNYTEAIKVFKNPDIPEGISIKCSLWMFGKPDALIVFTADNETAAGEFIVQFADFSEPKTALAMEVDQLRWLH